MRIVHVTNWQVPGYGYEEILLGRAQVELGHKVWIIASNSLYPKGFRVLAARLQQRRVAPRVEEVDGVRVMRLASVEVNTRIWIKGLRKALADINPDVIHVHNFLQFHPPRIATYRARGLDCALVVDDHTNLTQVRRGSVARIFYFLARQLYTPVVAPHVDAFSAKSSATRRYLIERCGVEQDVAVIPLGVDTVRFARSAAERARGRDRLGVGPDALVLLYTGKVVPSKGLELLVNGAAHLLPNFPALQVRAVGDADAPYVARLDSLAKEAGFEDGAWRWIPSIAHDNLCQIYSAADIAVWPAAESIGIFQAMASSLPVVTRAGTDFASLVGDGGLTFDGTALSLADVLRRLTDPATHDAAGARARAIAEGMSWTSLAETNLAMYSDAIAARRSVGAGSE